MAPTAPISFQLYSARNAPPEANVLKTLAEAGFTNVETYRPNYEDATAFRKALDEAGLTARSGHFDLTLAEENFDRVVELCRTLGIETVVIPYLVPDARPRDEAGWRELGQRLAELSAECNDEGLRLAWHNHDFEFVALPSGIYPIELILADGVLWEADAAWIVRAGGDPAEWIERFAGRIVTVHVKDIAPEGENLDEDGWADVGTGIVDWDRLWPLSVACGATMMIAEHDNPSDFGRFARVSAAKMRQLSGANAS
ncbi:sugar phosphate isomerase/epimerase family protein [Jiella mangrovi]|uniref:Sugar phosphate isomerase/epimerase n=1 Tax=Jiella mangrovi TaxID=2821407 RepID=A0ABS4BG28_9HYPH|nr:sugar phosphate isomerase/epimerase [Jiella mangrovi]MBP0615661.1 sugar phosphate isomerase/epimerase [Jiella mangrovi]